jgi:hypothetical protein
MLYAFLSIVVVVLGTVYGLHVWIKHLEADYHNAELDTLLTRMDTWDNERKLIVTTAEAVNADINKLKNMLAVSKRV